MSSPPKRQRTSDHDARIDPDETPTRARFQRRPDDDVFTEAVGPATRSVPPASSSFAPVLTNRPVFSGDGTEQYATSETSRTGASSRPSSPSKRAPKRTLKVPSLLDLAIPVRFTNPRVLEDVLPSDAQSLSQSLSIVAGKESILPAALQHHGDFKSSRYRPFMWAPPVVGATPDSYQTAVKNHEQLQDITEESTTSLALSRSEAAWNCRVHGPFLKFALRHADGIDFEPITSAQVLSSFRPKFKSKDVATSTTSSASAASSHDSAPLQNWPTAPASSVHKMVDFALVLKPDESLETLISDFLRGEPYNTASINQTRYEPLRTRPAPIFIETKTLSGTVESARVQMGIWIAAWHERMRTIIALGGEVKPGEVKPVITVPIIQVLDGLWTVFFVVDSGTEIVSLARQFVTSLLILLAHT
ncbi:hypothetical protein CCM_09623 [Cordyceps militaris CM01]|uniref:PD-(D/E)XK nuclease-like domain-containing protein n=1 Tax=Cordyceps militaris (strain CM01) TaxID=983644 RepID=G3JUY6_CORMM|nr:uncharacterized protein CCM_09623 [Cordyceps militaris CM01]EGX87662.1 hypothetical protein CCM_09623 [Cordyceps militaris CM01]